MFDWNDLRFLLAVGRGGSALAAARGLGVNQTTVARRVEALEHDLGITLFERRPDGYRLTPQGREMLVLAESVEAAARSLGDAAAAWKRDAAGVIRVTATELVAQAILAPLISELRLAYPALQIELVADDRRLSIASGEADVALRVGAPPEEADVIGRRIGDSHWGIFCSCGYADRHGVPRTPEELNRHGIIGGADSLAKLPTLVWLAQLAPQAPVVMRCNTVPNLIAAVRAGAGIGPLPLFAAADDPTLVRCLSGEWEHVSPIWLLYRAGLRDSPSFRVFLDAIVAAVGAARGRLTGHG